MLVCRADDQLCSVLLFGKTAVSPTVLSVVDPRLWNRGGCCFDPRLGGSATNQTAVSLRHTLEPAHHPRSWHAVGRTMAARTEVFLANGKWWHQRPVHVRLSQSHRRLSSQCPGGGASTVPMGSLLAVQPPQAQKPHAAYLYCSVEVSHNKMHRRFSTGPQMTTKRGTVEQQQATHQRSLGVGETGRRMPKR